MKILIRQQAAEEWAMVESASFTNEGELQNLLAESPALISISDIRPGAGPLVVTVREIGLPGAGNTDIIAFSALGDIAVVECKLAANAEIKRKVIGQALEYGAFLWGMTYEALDQRVQARTGKSLVDLIRDAAGVEDWDEEAFRIGVTETLANGTFVLLIAVDEMNVELARTVNFLNNCGTPAFAFAALEMRRFQRGATEILVPEILGASLVSTKTPQPPARRWTEETFMDAVKQLPAAAAETTRDLYAWSRAEADLTNFGQGKEAGSLRFKINYKGRAVSVLYLWSVGRLTIAFGALSDHLPSDVVLAFDRAIAAIPALSFMAGDVKRYPIVSIEKAFVAAPGTQALFKAVVLELVRKVRELDK